MKQCKRELSVLAVPLICMDYFFLSVLSDFSGCFGASLQGRQPARANEGCRRIRCRLPKRSLRFFLYTGRPFYAVKCGGSRMGSRAYPEGYLQITRLRFRFRWGERSPRAAGRSAPAGRRSHTQRKRILP